MLQHLNTLEIKDLPEKSYLGTTAEVKITELESHPIFMKVYLAVLEYFKTHNLKPAGPSVAVYKTWDSEAGLTQVMPAFTVDKNIDPGEFEVFTAPAKKAVVAEYKGAYSGLKNAHYEVMQYMMDNKLQGSLTVEEYLIFPDEGVAESDYLTRIIYYLDEA